MFFLWIQEILSQKILLDLIEEGLLIPGKMLACGSNLPYLEVNGISGDHSSSAAITPTF